MSRPPKTIVHISSDYPDILAPNKTRGVFNLVDATPEYRHVVYSLNRVNGWSGIAAVPFGEDRIAIAYGALPKGLFWGSRFRDLARWISKDLKKRNITPAMIEAHRFTVEGLSGQDLANEFACPFICDIQGKTDTRILAKKIDLRSRYREIARRVSLVFVYAPWALPPFQRLAGLEEAKCQCLPVIPGIDTLVPAGVIGDDKLLTVFHLDNWRLKNVFRVIQAIENLASQRPSLTLDIYGSGQPRTLLKLSRVIQNSPVADRIRLRGAVENSKLPELMQGYAAFVMPSLSESYGLVYAEALFAGLPVLFSEGRGIDGYFEEKSIGYACEPESVDDITTGINHLLTHQAKLKQEIARLQAEGGLDIIRKNSIIKTYRNGMKKALTAH